MTILKDKYISIKLDDVQLHRFRKVFLSENPLKEIEFADRLNKYFGIKLKHFQHQKINHQKITGHFHLFFDDCDLNENLYILFCNKTNQYTINTPKYLELYANNTLFGNIETLEKRDFYAIGQDDFSIFKSDFSNINYFFLIESKKSDSHLENIISKIFKNSTLGFLKEIDFQNGLSLEKNVKSWEDCLNEIFMTVELHVGQKRQENNIFEQIMINQRRKDLDKHQQNIDSPNIS